MQVVTSPIKFMTPDSILAVVEAVGLLGVAVFVVAQWRLGKSTVSADTIQAYKDQLEIVEKRYATTQETVNAQAGKIGELKGALDARDAQIADYKQILENRDPTLNKTLEEILSFMKQVDGRLTEIAVHQKKPFVTEVHATTTK